MSEVEMEALKPASWEPHKLPERLRNARMMVNRGNGDVRDEPDPLHEEAADFIESNMKRIAILEQRLSEAQSQLRRHSPPVPEAVDALVERAGKLLSQTRDCTVCEGDGIKNNGNICGGCDGSGKRPQQSGPVADFIRAAAEALTLLARERKTTIINDPDEIHAANIHRDLAIARASASDSRLSDLTVEVERLTRPIIGIENRTAQEAFDIMADRIRRALSTQKGDHPDAADKR